MHDGHKAVPVIRTMTTPKREKVGDDKYWTCTVSGIDGKSWVKPIGKPFVSTNLELVTDPPKNFTDRWVGEYIMGSQENRLTFLYQANACRPVGKSFYDPKDKVRKRKYQFYKMINRPRGIIQPKFWKD